MTIFNLKDVPIIVNGKVQTIEADEQKRNEVETLGQVGRCIYARPCGCRIMQGRVPEVWKESER